MKKIGITQQVVFHDRVKERRDMLDQSWTSFASKLGIYIIPIPNALTRPDEFADQLELDGLIFSGGNNISLSETDNKQSLFYENIAVERDYTEAVLLKWAIEKNKIVVGVCRGMQFIIHFFGGKLRDVDSSVHVAKEHNIDFTNKIFSDIYGINCMCNSFHRFGVPIDSLPAEIRVAGAYNQEAEAIYHSLHSITGIMWHPERYAPFRMNDIHLFSKIFKTIVNHE